MSEISVSRGAYQKMKSGAFVAGGGDERVASFLANKFEEGEREQRALTGDDPAWLYTIWTYRF